MFQLRPNQIEPVRVGVEFFKTKNTVPSIIVAPTAFGKSIVIAHIAKEIGERILIIQPTVELLEQNYNKFITLGGEASIYSASMNEKEIGSITYATIGSIINIAYKFRELGIKKVIIDECDRYPRDPTGMLRRFITGAKVTHILGLTATPLKLQTNLGEDKKPVSKLVMLTVNSNKGNFFKKIIYVSQIKEMVEMGFWSRLEYQSYDFNTGQLVYNTTGSDYSDASIRRAYRSQKIGDKIVKKVQQLYNRKSILIAVPSIGEARELSKRLPSCEAVYSNMPIKERKRIVEEFKRGKLRIVVQVNILSVGFDHPELDTIISGRPTASLSWWYQFIGRVTRIHPDKAEGLVVDFVGSVPKFGKVEDLFFKQEDGIWKLYGEGGKLLTGIPITQIGLHIEGKPTPKELADKGPKVIMPFGKWKGKELKEIPTSYRDWMLDSFKWTSFNQHIKDELLRLKDIGI